MAINAMQEGKDVYLEKPISHVYNEGHAIVEASKQYDRVLQQGSQMRNSPVTARAEKLLRDGIIVRPVANYGLPQHLRITVGLPEQNTRVLESLAICLESAA